mmetsp:Transcript_5995/g.8985  ORF Transcript_5995/g.8985 Transcript_5995/m.8985 type:complete len:259 (+) Transcript_5995:401-1177(+)
MSAFSYCTFLSTDVAASQPHFSASARARTPIPSRNLASISFSAQAVYPSMSPASTRKPVSLSRMRSGMPPAAHPTTGTPLAMLSRTTNPSVSESLGIINASALANALLNSSPVNCPVNTVSVPSKYSFNSSSYGPVPTKHILALSPNLSNTGLISFNRFSPPNRPTYTMRNLSVSPSVILLLISSLSNLGSNRTVSIPFRQTSTRGTPCSSISAFICGLVTRVRSARECTHRSSAHASSSRAGIHCPYCRAYSGRWVW